MISFCRSQDKDVLATSGQNVLCTSTRIDVTSLEPCIHEEADTRLLLRVKHALENSHTKVLIRMVDNDFTVLAVRALQLVPIKHFW